MSKLTNTQVVGLYNYLRKLELEVGLYTPTFIQKYTKVFEQLKYNYPLVPYDTIFKTKVEDADHGRLCEITSNIV